MAQPGPCQTPSLYNKRAAKTRPNPKGAAFSAAPAVTGVLVEEAPPLPPTPPVAEARPLALADAAPAPVALGARVALAAAPEEDDDSEEEDAATDADDEDDEDEPAPPPAPAAFVQLPAAKLAEFCASVLVKPPTICCAMLCTSAGTLLTTALMSACELVLMVSLCWRTVSHAPACWMASFLADRLVTRDWASVWSAVELDCSCTASVTLSSDVPCTVVVPLEMVSESAVAALCSGARSPEKAVAAALRADRDDDTELRTPWMVCRSRCSMMRFSRTTRVGESMTVAEARPARQSAANFIANESVG